MIRTEALLLFRVVFQVRDDLLWLLILAFHLVSVAHLSDSFKNDLVVRAKPLLDDKNIVQLILDFDLALMRHVVFIDDENVSLLENLEGGPLWDDDGAMLH